VVDTLARCFVGDDNLQEDMGSFIKAVDRLRHTFDAAVLVVHHSRLDGERERGSTAFRGATDTVLKVDKVDALITLTCETQKDAEAFEPLEFILRKIGDTASCIAVLASRVDDERERVQDFFKMYPDATVRDAEQALDMSKSAVHRRIKELRASGTKI
jgi:hypothetical protein